ncbi:hypothetical protein GP486_005304 [Trichoglossum hirsutum]|uniref:Uncharacterized protein n=1 Tax=Trichoglossum hirsutum TaxID=265104 RepID=A0A9P8L9H9_9PEZI|nr:hypothetical protein GP486_005304 [Trichoglossum hirsutum]
MPMTLLSYLTRANPVLTMETSVGTNTNSTEWLPIEGVCDWTEFNYRTLHSIFQDSWQIMMWADIPVLDEGLPLCEIFAEDGLGHLIATWNAQVVSRALRESGGRLLMVAGSSAQLYTGVVPDWAGIQKDHRNPGKKTYRNYCPGDTKLNTRYGYILTDKELVVIRVIKSADPPPHERPRRSTAQYEPGHLRDLSDVSSALSEISIYGNTGELENYEKLEIKSIPWSNEGPSELTVNLALWYLLSMAGVDNSIEMSYPPLDSRRLKQEGSELEPRIRYCHVTSGKMTSSLPARAYVLPTTIITTDPSAEGSSSVQAGG